MGKKAQRRRAARTPTRTGPSAEAVAEFFETPLDRSLVDVDLTPELRLARLAAAHAAYENDVLHTTSCAECEAAWPCPTYQVVTVERFTEDPFEVRDRALYSAVGME